MNDLPPPMVRPEHPLSVMLSVAQWRTVLEQLANGPFKIVAALMGDIDRQCQAQIARLQQQQPDMPAPLHRGNGTEDWNGADVR